MSNPFIKPTAYAGSCIACFQGTDTGLTFRGSPEWCVAGLTIFGLSQASATAAFHSGVGHLAEVMEVTYRVCRSCVAGTGLPEPQLILPGHTLPGIIQPEVVA